MKLLLEIDDSIFAQYKISGYMDIRLHKDEDKINYITVATNENPYFNLLPFQLLPNNCQILTKEAYEDLCKRSCMSEQEKWRYGID